MFLKIINKKFSNILVTGANKGLGFEVIRKLVDDDLKENNKETYNIVLTSRDQEKGIQAIQNLKLIFNENNNLEEKLQYYQLDITKKDSIENCISSLKVKNDKNSNEAGIIDILLNNAGVAYPGNKISVDIFEDIFSTNVYGTIDFTEKILIEKLMRKNSKIIFLSSSLGKISRLCEKIKSEFEDENITTEKLIEFSERFRNSIINKTYFSEGWGKHIYALSKIMVKKYANILTKHQYILDNNIQVYSCCPGWVRTDMGGANASRSVEEGIQTILYLINLENKVNIELQGKFFYDCKISNF